MSDPLQPLADAATPETGARLAHALDLHRTGKIADAEHIYQDILNQEPNNPDALHLLGVTRTQRGDPAAGIVLIQRALERRPNAANYHNNLGKAFSERRDWRAAAACYGRVVELSPGSVEGHFNLAAALAALGERRSAEESYRRVLGLSPRHAGALNNLGYLLLEMGRAAEGEACFRAALDAAPENTDALINLGSAARLRGAYADAERCFTRALDLRPDFANAHIELGSLYMSMGALDQATAAQRRAVELAPGNKAALANLAYLRVIYADFAEAGALYAQAIALDPADLRPARFRTLEALYDPALSEDDRGRINADFARAVAVQRGPRRPPIAADRDPDRRLRVGILSGDFYIHPVARNLEPLLAHFDRAGFELIAYADHAKEDALTARLRGLVDVWRPTAGLSDAESAETIRNDRVDILLLLAGRFDRNRPQVAQWRAAPVQISFHDPGPSGLSETDYLIADPMLIPRGAPERFTERVLRLPNFYLHGPVDSAPDVGPPPIAARGVPTFGSFNNPAKLNDRALALWGDALRAAPAARLILKFKNWFGNSGLRDHALKALAIDPARVEFRVGDTGPHEHLSLYNEIDIALDPEPFSGSTTTFEALWMGVPVVTMTGATMASRWSASMLRGLKLNELIAGDRAQYVRIAAALAADAPRLASLRQGLRARVAASPLCNGAHMARHLGRMLRAVWRRHCAEKAGPAA